MRRMALEKDALMFALSLCLRHWKPPALYRSRRPPAPLDVGWTGTRSPTKGDGIIQSYKCNK